MCDNYLILTCALYYKNLTETACKHAPAAARNPECNSSTDYAADVTSYATTYSTQSPVHSTRCNQQRTTEKARKAARRGLCTCNHPMRLTPLVRNRSQLFLLPAHQCYATSTHLQATRQRERDISSEAVRVLRQVGEGFNTLTASPDMSHSRCRIYRLTCCLTLTCLAVAGSSPRPHATSTKRAPLVFSRPHPR